MIGVLGYAGGRHIGVKSKGMDDYVNIGHENLDEGSLTSSLCGLRGWLMTPQDEYDDGEFFGSEPEFFFPPERGYHRMMPIEDMRDNIKRPRF